MKDSIGDRPMEISLWLWNVGQNSPGRSEYIRPGAAARGAKLRGSRGYNMGYRGGPTPRGEQGPSFYYPGSHSGSQPSEKLVPFSTVLFFLCFSLFLFLSRFLSLFFFLFQFLHLTRLPSFFLLIPVLYYCIIKNNFLNVSMRDIEYIFPRRKYIVVFFISSPLYHFHCVFLFFIVET